MKKGTEGKGTLESSARGAGATEASTWGALASDSRELRETDEADAIHRAGEPGAEGDQDGRGRVTVKLSGPKSGPSAHSAWGVLALGLAAGLGVGWLGRDFQVTHAKKADAASIQSKNNEAGGPCKVWTDTICGRMGELAYECTQARAASSLLSDSACAQAQESVLAKVEAIKAERVQCSELTTKFCADLGPEGKGCELARAKEPTFSIKDCQDMTKTYPRVLAQIMERQEKGTLPNPPRGPRRELEITKPN